MWENPIVEQIRAYRDEHAGALQRGQGQVSHLGSRGQASHFPKLSVIFTIRLTVAQ